MSIRTRTLLIVGVTSLILIAALYAFSQLILGQNYASLEQETVTRDVQRAVNALADKVKFLQNTAIDYAHWDDTYHYIQGLDETYPETNILDSVFENYGLNFIIFINDTGEIVYSQAFDLQTEDRIPVPPTLTTFVSHNEGLLHPKDTAGHLLQDGISGLALLSGEEVMFAASPIFASDVAGQPHGALIWGSFINAQFMTKLADQTQLTLQGSAIEAAETDRNFTHVLPLALTQSITVRPLSNDTVTGSTALNDVNNAPALLLTVKMPRSIYQEGQKSLTYFLGSLVFLGVISACVIWVLLERGVLSRLANLNKHVSQIQRSGDITSRVSMKGKDELTTLATNVNLMLDTLQAQEKIKLARDNALEAARLKAEILTNVSHEARTPLTVIQMRAELLEKGVYGPLNDRQLEVLETILLSCQQLLGFVKNLLEGAKLESGHLKLNIEETEPSNLLASIKTTLGALAQKKNLILETQLDVNLPKRVLTDTPRLEQILTNLVTNAIKFTNSGLVIARIYRVDSEHWALEVKDSGTGISPEHQKQIFTPFWQVDSSATRANSSGVGLGLAIVHQLTELMNGRVSVTSALGQGSTFTVVLPLLLPTKGTEHAEATVRTGD